MRRLPVNNNSEVGNSINGVVWKKRPSELRGYLRTLYCTDSNDDYIRVDYNLRDKKVRLYVESVEEGGIEYYSIINNGKVNIERNLTSGRATSLYSKLSKRAHVFASIPNRQVLKLIGDNYNISGYIRDNRRELRKDKLELTRKRYFARDKKNIGSTLGDFSSEKSITLVDFLDIIIGIAILMIIFYYSYNYMMCGVIAAIYGIFLGVLDMFARKREPIFFKIIIFLLSGFVSYIYGYYLF